MIQTIRKVSILFLFTLFSSLHAQELLLEDFQKQEAKLLFGGFLRHGVFAFSRKEAPQEKGTLYSSHSTFRLNTDFEIPLNSAWLFKVSSGTDAEAAFTNHNDSSLAQALYFTYPKNRLLNLQKKYLSKDGMASVSVHHAYASLESDFVHFSFGRKVVSLGNGRMLNPLDLVTPIDVLTFDFESVPAADLASTTFFLSDTNFIELIVIPYRRLEQQEIHAKDVNYIARGSFSLSRLDLQLLGGKHFHADVIGMENTYSSDFALFRMAALYRKEPEFHGDPYLPNLSQSNVIQLVAGISKTYEKFSWNVEFFADLDKQRKRRLEVVKYNQAITAGQAIPYPNDETFFITAGRLITKNEIFMQTFFTASIISFFFRGISIVNSFGITCV
ncbi:MAG: hypothetical protein D6767_02015 [Candidatus Hydrogenedentota bacterium]|nr:MAG: hypothetical protein D6767_02015 [Candidatus Hydrogenedentota bacterium]